MKLNSLKKRLYQIEQELGLNKICFSYKNLIIYSILIFIVLYIIYKLIKFCFKKNTDTKQYDSITTNSKYNHFNPYYNNNNNNNNEYDNFIYEEQEF